MENFLENQIPDPLAYIALTLRKLDTDIFNIPQSGKKEIVENLSFYIIDKLVSNGYGVTVSQAKKLSKKYLWKFEQIEKKYYRIK